jgi:cyanoexosortase A
MLSDYFDRLSFKKIDTWLLVIGTGLVAIHISVVGQIDQEELLGNSFLLWAAVCLLIWKKRDKINFDSSPLSTTLGLFLVTFVVVRTVSISETNFFVRLSPLISLIGWSLLASGVRGLKHYVKELVILTCLLFNSTFMSHVFNLSTFTAKVAGYLLWYLGFPVSVRGVYIALPTGSVEVNSGCSGYTIILQLIGLSIVFLSLFPTKINQKIILPISAVIIGFVVNIVRVALMALLVANNRKEAFEYWHKADGSLVFSGIGVLIFSLFYHVLTRNNETESSESETSEI